MKKFSLFAFVIATTLCACGTESNFEFEPTYTGTLLTEKNTCGGPETFDLHIQLDTQLIAEAMIATLAYDEMGNSEVFLGTANNDSFEVTLNKNYDNNSHMAARLIGSNFLTAPRLTLSNEMTRSNNYCHMIMAGELH